jgi:glutamate 5-kinase
VTITARRGASDSRVTVASTTMTTDVVVVKIGTSSVTNDAGGVDRSSLDRVAHDVATLHQRGLRCVVVTSGAITAGWSEVGGSRARPRDAVTLQAVSAVGQPLLMDAWRAAFATHSLHVGQVLLAPLDFAHRGQYLHARATIQALWDLGVVPIVNENDAVADEEIRFGDNDRLAALVANLVAANLLVLLTDTAGLLTADPRLDGSATLIEVVTEVDAGIEDAAGASASVVGSGGMASKLAAARLATWSGVETVIAPARRDGPLTAVVDRVAGVGTRFVARPQRLAARKAWIAFAAASRGRVVVNDGAARALVGEGRSLLRVGVVRVDGEFNDGDAIAIMDERGHLLAKGLVRASSERFSEGDDPVVHRDDLVVVTPEVPALRLSDAD